ncbi:hypothetical protein GCM10010271_57300 [Streptomyces kurssanovii]|nr:hypothetical protein GCM10010271_57300 [Streptomyces kurssanovii]
MVAVTAFPGRVCAGARVVTAERGRTGAVVGAVQATGHRPTVGGRGGPIDPRRLVEVLLHVTLLPNEEEEVR